MESVTLPRPSAPANQPEWNSIPQEGSPMRVMVVDDAATVRHRLLASLRKAHGVTEVAQAASGEEALELLEEFKPDLITLDLMLPGMSGLEVLEEIRKRDAEVKIVILTNYPYPAFRRKCLAMGANQFYGKSTETDRILEVARVNSSPPEKVESADGDPT